MQARKMESRVMNELKLHFRLKHPSVLKLYRYIQDRDYVYLILELCHNGELTKFIKARQRRLRESEGKGEKLSIICRILDVSLFSFVARKIFRQIVEGLLYLHSEMIIHRDLSLSNILLTRSMDAVSL